MADGYLQYLHRARFEYYWKLAHGEDTHPQQKPQWYRWAIETGAVMGYLDGYVNGMFTLNGTQEEILKTVNKATGLKKPVTLRQMRRDLGTILLHIGAARGYVPRDSPPIKVSRSI